MERKDQTQPAETNVISEYGKTLMVHVDTSPGQKILDLGCGTGDLTAVLAANGADVLGIDNSAEMIVKARYSHPELMFAEIDALELPYDEEFDTVFSNSVFHWIPDVDHLLAEIRRALKPGGKLVCEFGAASNIATMRQAFAAASARHGREYRERFYCPTPDEFFDRLKAARFEPERVLEFDRQTPLPGGADGLRHWVCRFLKSDLEPFSASVQEQILTEVETACRPLLWNGSEFIVDYRRLRAVAFKR
ncbi:trans-aconitate 2-methyltransferase [uncultured Victivallis sp.]|uniref:class I SAM-dependent methyltransferase n=1 Tax=uncultured Victivallis sp. TaxID=354118 RepID=UPI0025F0B8D1|nr:class I SAM-dependent methyltransferase [uncultured Victivallis sp.]